METFQIIFSMHPILMAQNTIRHLLCIIELTHAMHNWCQIKSRVVRAIWMLTHAANTRSVWHASMFSNEPSQIGND